ncbi:hypothetical protein DFR76_102589 [Nocardia pseudobrasiliensis]|uniref:Secreted protein n=1 Tax=Nocardia pseudobrasiliensis TaxID=45979 RepID=A0A370IBS8_9NOCA|nr:hypothetical protein DFR76_102589 [Nocardia pseudobrasiliensis]
MATLGVLATAIALAAPQAGATVTSIRVDHGQSFGSSDPALGAGCSYPVVATTDPGQEVIFVDEADGHPIRGGFQPAVVIADATGTARTTWTPANRGQHRVLVAEFRSDDDFDTYSHRAPYTVGTGITVGPNCVVLP